MKITNGGVVVTGASSGIGEACALRLAQLGFQVFAGVRHVADADRLRAVAPERLRPLLLDITNPDAIAAAVDVVTNAVGEMGLAALVNNAGIAVAGSMEFLPLPEMRRQFEVNVIGHLAVTQAFLPLLRRGQGRIINVGSTAGRSVLPFAGAYSASKHALRAMNAALRMELQPWGIAVALIEPGIIATPIWTRSVPGGISGEHVANSRERKLYGRNLDSAHHVAREQATAGSPVGVVTGAIVHAVTSGRPRTHYTVGHGARLRTLLEKLPVPVRDRIILWRVLHHG